MKQSLFISCLFLLLMPVGFTQSLMDKDTLYITADVMNTYKIADFDLETSVVIQVKVEGSGNVLSAKSTINMVHDHLLKLALEEAKKKKYPPKTNSKDVYMATVTYIFIKK